MDVLSCMTEYGLRPNLQCFTIALQTLGDEPANWQLVLDVVDMMREHGRDPTAIVGSNGKKREPLLRESFMESLLGGGGFDSGRG